MNARRSQGFIWVCLVFMVCLGLRLGVALTIDTFVSVNKSVDLYAQLATNLLHGQGFVLVPGGEPVLWRAPLYPLFLAAVFALEGEGNTLGILVAQSTLDAVSATVIYWVGRQLFSDFSGLIAGVFFALHPLSAYYSLRFLPESMFTLCLTAVVASMVWASQSRQLIPCFAVGMACAIAALVKPVALFLSPFLCVALLWRSDLDWRNWLQSSLMILLGTIITVLPWTMRNYAVTQTIIPVATGGGYALWLGNHRGSSGREDWELDETAMAVMHKERQAIQAAVGPNSHSESRRITHNVTPQLDRAFAKAALSEFREDPLESGFLLVRKFFRFWFSVFLPENQWAQWYISVFQTLILGLSLAGAVAYCRDWDRIVPLLVPLGYLTVLHTLTFATLRYSIATTPILMLLLVVGASHLNHVTIPYLITRLRGRSPVRLSPVEVVKGP